MMESAEQGIVCLLLREDALIHIVCKSCCKSISRTPPRARVEIPAVSSPGPAFLDKGETLKRILDWCYKALCSSPSYAYVAMSSKVHWLARLLLVFVEIGFPQFHMSSGFIRGIGNVSY